VHAGTQVEVCIEQRDDVIHVEVRDHRRASVLVGAEPPGPEDTHGRGLFLVDALAAAWGITEQPDGKVIWFDVTDGSDHPAPTADRAAVIRSALVIGASTGLYAAAFGAVAVAAGASVAQSMVLSLLVFTGGSQFAATGVLDGGGSPAAALGAGWLLGVRNAF
jgi:hypothetical protein